MYRHAFVGVVKGYRRVTRVCGSSSRRRTREVAAVAGNSRPRAGSKRVAWSTAANCQIGVEPEGYSIEVLL